MKETDLALAGIVEHGGGNQVIIKDNVIPKSTVVNSADKGTDVSFSMDKNLCSSRNVAANDCNGFNINGSLWGEEAVMDETIVSVTNDVEEGKLIDVGALIKGPEHSSLSILIEEVDMEIKIDGQGGLGIDVSGGSAATRLLFGRGSWEFFGLAWPKLFGLHLWRQYDTKIWDPGSFSIYEWWEICGLIWPNLLGLDLWRCPCYLVEHEVYGAGYYFLYLYVFGCSSLCTIEPIDSHNVIDQNVVINLNNASSSVEPLLEDELVNNIMVEDDFVQAIITNEIISQKKVEKIGDVNFHNETYMEGDVFYEEREMPLSRGHSGIVNDSNFLLNIKYNNDAFIDNEDMDMLAKCYARDDNDTSYTEGHGLEVALHFFCLLTLFWECATRLSEGIFPVISMCWPFLFLEPITGLFTSYLNLVISISHFALGGLLLWFRLPYRIENPLEYFQCLGDSTLLSGGGSNPAWRRRGGSRGYMGTITGISDLNPIHWPNSHWRSVKEESQILQDLCDSFSPSSYSSDANDAKQFMKVPIETLEKMGHRLKVIYKEEEPQSLPLIAKEWKIKKMHTEDEVI
ncbi:Auxin response factor 8 [Dendrobium catenatum]|uniref:Auxin response factor 8 n=1 Tax=Dendrobium catenatum TaxID=906689 RepID=A0A2I0V9H2_9ASPA|nr:Auxin response factor 8 [Dendrobium catenatum]